MFHSRTLSLLTMMMINGDIRWGEFRLWELAPGAGIGSANATHTVAALQIFNISDPKLQLQNPPAEMGASGAVSGGVRPIGLCAAWEGGCQIVAAARAGLHSMALHMLQSR